MSMRRKEESFLTLSFIILLVKERSSVIRLCNDDEDEEKARIGHFKSLISSSSLLKKDYTREKVTFTDIKKIRYLFKWLLCFDRLYCIAFLQSYIIYKFIRKWERERKYEKDKSLLFRQFFPFFKFNTERKKLIILYIYYSIAEPCE